LRVLVTGASGHVGTAIALHLTARGDEVVGLGRRLTKGNRGLAGAIAVDLGRAGVAGALAGEQPPCDAIVHTAAAIDEDPFAPELSLTNGLGTQQIVELAVRWEVSSLIHISSVPVIGVPRELPVSEEHPVAPLTAYHASKLYAERLVAIAGHDGLRTASLRLTAPIGPGMPEARILSVFVRRALAGEPLRLAGAGRRGQDYVDVRDVAEAVGAAIDRRAAGVLNIASGRCVTNRELAERCVDVLGSRSAVELSGQADPDDGVRWEVSVSRARQVLSYEPRWSLEESIAAVAESVRETVAHA
jgi:nucleoside-diphosphate-sugar epimerase